MPKNECFILQAAMMTPEGPPLTTHILDTSRGVPAAGVPITLSLLDDDNNKWIEVDKRYRSVIILKVYICILQ